MSAGIAAPIAKLLVERAVLEVSALRRVVRVGGLSDFDVGSDPAVAGINQAFPDLRAVRYPQNPIQRDVTGNFLITGQIQDQIATHSACDIVVSAYGRHAALFTGAMNNTDVFFRIMRAALGDADITRDIVNCVLRSVPIP